MVELKEVFKDSKNQIFTHFLKLFSITTITLVLSLTIKFFIARIENTTVKNIFTFFSNLLEIILVYGVLISFLKDSHDENITLFDFIKIGFSSILRLFKLAIMLLVKLILPMVFLVICIFIFSLGYALNNNIISLIGMIIFILSIIYFIVKALPYAVSFFILYDNPNLSEKEVLEKSATLMKGNRYKFFSLNLYMFLVYISAFIIYYILITNIIIPTYIIPHTVILLLSIIFLMFMYSLQTNFYNSLQ